MTTPRIVRRARPDAVSTPRSALAFRAGGRKGLVDAEALKRHIYADRLVATRPPVTL